MTIRKLILWLSVLTIIFGIAVVVGLSAPPGVKIGLIVSVVMGFIALADAIVRPREGFRAVGAHKGRWLLVLTLGTMLAFGAIPAVWYWTRFHLWKISIDGPGGGRGPTSGPFDPSDPSGGPRRSDETSTARVICDPCKGTGAIDGAVHYTCGGRGYI